MNTLFHISSENWEHYFCIILNIFNTCYIIQHNGIRSRSHNAITYSICTVWNVDRKVAKSIHSFIFVLKVSIRSWSEFSSTKQNHNMIIYWNTEEFCVNLDFFKWQLWNKFWIGMIGIDFSQMARRNR